MSLVDPKPDDMPVEPDPAPINPELSAAPVEQASAPVDREPASTEWPHVSAAQRPASMEPGVVLEERAFVSLEPDPAPAVDDPAPAGHRPKVVALLNQKGGVGKTTSTVNLGAALARYGRRVLLVDLDPQSNLSLHFGVEPQEGQPTVHELLLDEDVTAEQATMHARAGLDFIPSVTELALVEGELAQRPDMQHVLRRRLQSVAHRYDVILLDCPPSLGVLSVNALTLADEVFVPMQAHYLPLRGLEKLLQTVHLVAQGLNPDIRVTGVLLCMHEGKSGHSRAVIDEIQAQLEQYRGSGLPWQDAQVLHPPVRRNIKLAEAPSFGKTIFDYAPRCPGADDYRRIALMLLERWGMPIGDFDGPLPRRQRDSNSNHAAGRSPRPSKPARQTRRSAATRAAAGKRPPDEERQVRRKTRGRGAVVRAATTRAGGARVGVARAEATRADRKQAGSRKGSAGRKAAPLPAAKAPAGKRGARAAGAKANAGRKPGKASGKRGAASRDPRGGESRMGTSRGSAVRAGASRGGSSRGKRAESAPRKSTRAGGSSRRGMRSGGLSL